jgi:hypothetical protein
MLAKKCMAYLIANLKWGGQGDELRVNRGLHVKDSRLGKALESHIKTTIGLSIPEPSQRVFAVEAFAPITSVSRFVLPLADIPGTLGPSRWHGRTVTYLTRL